MGRGEERPFNWQRKTQVEMGRCGASGGFIIYKLRNFDRSLPPPLPLQRIEFLKKGRDLMKCQVLQPTSHVVNSKSVHIWAIVVVDQILPFIFDGYNCTFPWCCRLQFRLVYRNRSHWLNEECGTDLVGFYDCVEFWYLEEKVRG